MKTQFKLLALFLMLLMVLQSTAVTAFAITPIDVSVDIHQAAGQPSKYSSQYNSGQRDVVATTLNGTSADAYYNGNNEYDVLSEKSANEIKNALATLMKSTHTYISSYDDCHYKAHRTDCENETGSSNKLSLIYTSYTATQSQWNGWNREHVWPKSLGGNNTSGGGADMHHIRPSDAVVNSTRSNDKYGNVSGGKAVYGRTPASGCLGGYSGGSYFEPLDNVKGDVARICLYVWIRWGSAWGADSITEVFQSVDVLLAWMELDPVDTWELGRNEVIQDIQGNRNVFIDYPEYAWLIFGKEVPSDMVTPSGEASEGACDHNFSVTSSTQATCTSGGSTTYTCSNCKHTKTETVDKLGHSLGNWVIDVEATETTKGSKHRDCSRCDYTETVTIPLVGHNHTYTSTVTAPTCTEKGYTTHTCDCGEYYIDSYTNIVAHTYVGSTCSNCGAKDPNAPTYTKEDFSNIITSLASGRYIGQNKYNKICEAINIYNSLSADDKKSLSSKYDILITIVTQYNDEVENINADSNVFGALPVVTVDVSVIWAAYTILNKKYF